MGPDPSPEPPRTRAEARTPLTLGKGQGGRCGLLRGAYSGVLARPRHRARIRVSGTMAQPPFSPFCGPSVSAHPQPSEGGPSQLGGSGCSNRLVAQLSSRRFMGDAVPY